MGIISGDQAGQTIQGGNVMRGAGTNTPLTLDGVPVDAVVEIQDVDDGDATGGDFTLTVPGFGTTVAIAEDDDAAAVKAALDAIDGVSVTVTGTGEIATPFEVTFNLPLGDVPLMTAVDSTTGGAGVTVAANTEGVSGSYEGIIPAGGLVKDSLTGDIYENDGTESLPTFSRIDTV